MTTRWFKKLCDKMRSYKPLDMYPDPMLLLHEYYLISGGFVRRGGQTIVWSRTYCPDCGTELYYDNRFRTLSFPPQVKARCMHGHIYCIDTPLPAEPFPV